MRKLILLLAITQFFGLEAFSQKDKFLFKAPLGVQAYTFRKQFPKGVEATLDTIKMLGFTEIEASAPKGYTIEQFKKSCAERGILIPSTGCGFDELIKDPKGIADKAKQLGASFVMTAWIPHKGDNFTIEEAKNAVEVFNNAGKVLKENGITFCYHNHGYEFRPHQNGTLLDYIIQNTDPEYVSFEMDVLWTIQGGGDPVSLLKKYKNRWKLMHVKDFKIGGIKDFSGHTPAENDVVLGTGEANWRKIISLANKLGIKHFFIEDESEHEIQNIPLSLNYLKSLKK